MHYEHNAIMLLPMLILVVIFLCPLLVQVSTYLMLAYAPLFFSCVVRQMKRFFSSISIFCIIISQVRASVACRLPPSPLSLFVSGPRWI